MTNKNIKARKKPTYYPQKISAKINEEQRRWFWEKANNRKMSLSEFIRSIPDEIDGLNEEMNLMESDMNKLKKSIRELLEIKGLQELIADFKHTGKEGIILNQKNEISELTKSVMSLTGKNVKLKEEIKKLKTLIEDKKSVEEVFLEPDDPNYDKFKEMYDKINKDGKTAGKKSKDIFDKKYKL